MRRTIQVFIGDPAARVGVIHHDAQGARERAAFEYADEWLSSPDAFALAPDLRLVGGAQFHNQARSVFHDAIADTEPDGWGRRIILRDHAKRRQEAKRAGEPAGAVGLGGLDFLLAVDDVSRSTGPPRRSSSWVPWCRRREPSS